MLEQARVMLEHWDRNGSGRLDDGDYQYNNSHQKNRAGGHRPSRDTDLYNGPPCNMRQPVHAHTRGTIQRSAGAPAWQQQDRGREEKVTRTRGNDNKQHWNHGSRTGKEN